MYSNSCVLLCCWDARDWVESVTNTVLAFSSNNIITLTASQYELNIFSVSAVCLLNYEEFLVCVYTFPSQMPGKSWEMHGIIFFIHSEQSSHVFLVAWDEIGT